MLVPVKGQDEARELMAERNRINGAAWNALSLDEKEAFSPPIFYALAGVPNPLISNNSDDFMHRNQDGDGFVPSPKVDKLTLEEDNLYRPLYNKLVDLPKVERELGKQDTCGSTVKIQRKSASAIEKFAHTVSGITTGSYGMDAFL